MKGTKEDVSAELNAIADGIKDIANDILYDNYDPTKWVELSRKMTLVTMCLKVQESEFVKHKTV